MPLFGCWSCYHHSTMSQFGGDPKGRRARGFYGTFKVHWCGKDFGDDKVSTFYRCENYDPNGGFGFITGAGFEGYDTDKKRGEPERASREDWE